MNVDYIIVGLGLAGLAFAERLKESNKSFVVYENNSQNSSLIAGGVYNPVILKRFTPVWNGHEQLQFALPFYEKLEKELSENFDKKFNTKKIFNSVGDQNNWFLALDKPNLAYYMKPLISTDKIDGVIGDFGFGELEGTGRIDTEKLITAYRNNLQLKGLLKEEQFEYNELVIREDELSYKEITSNKIVFCEGFGLKENPFFKELPLQGTKGETLTIHAPNLNIDFLLKSSVFVLPLGNDKYKVGATFNWDDKTERVTKEGRQELEEKLQKTISVPYKVLNQYAGIRPTVKNRRPLVGVHPKHKNIAVLNGLGTRGVMIAPTVSKNLYDYLENNIPLDKEIDIKRFSF